MLSYEGCLNPAKSHLWGLPNRVKPTTDYPGESKDGIGIFPIFGVGADDHSIEHHIVKSALWARRSFIEYTDAVELDISLKFYVELGISDRVIPILRENGVNIDRDVLYFDGRYFEGDWIFLGKKLAAFNDDQFADYKWLWFMDVDMFASSPNRTKCNFFGELMGSPLEIGASELFRFDPDETFKDKHWWWRIEGDTDEEKQKEWLSRIFSLVDPSVVAKYTTMHSDAVQVGGWLYSFPASHFLNNRKDDCEWIAYAGKVMQDDEAVFSIWHSLNKPLIDLEKEVLSVPIVNEHEDVTAHFERGDPYIVHVGMAPFQYHWRAGFDSL